MDAVFVGIDVSKNRLDVAVWPGGESFAVGRNGAGIDELIARLQARPPMLVAVEATGGFETIVAAGLAARASRQQSADEEEHRPAAQGAGEGVVRTG
jgi:transposase